MGLRRGGVVTRNGWVDDPARQCVGKRRFGTGSEARRQMKVMMKRQVATRKLTVYECPHCGWWHIGGAAPQWKIDAQRAAYEPGEAS